MSNNETFIQFLYNEILGRQPDLAGATHYLIALESCRLDRETLLLQFIQSPEFRERTRAQMADEHVPAGHYYSAIPSDGDRKAALAYKHESNAIPGIDLRWDAQYLLLCDLQRFFEDCPFPDDKGTRFRYYFRNRSYSFGDGLTLYAMMRHFRPRRIVEIGSGYTSALMMDVNEFFADGQISLVFIEPYADLLRSLMKIDDQKHEIVEKTLQSSDPACIESLDINDILFIDSTHVSKLNSDVNRAMFDLLPRLKPGVLVHFHDIFWPFEYPAEWIMEKRAWNEAYLLRAFLQYNSDFEIVFFSHALATANRHWFEVNAPRFLLNSGANIWLRRKMKMS